LDLVTINAAYPELSRVPLQGFAAWACSIGWEVPEAFAEIGRQWTSQTKTKAEVDKTGTLGKRAESTYLNIIGAMLELMLSKSHGCDNHIQPSLVKTQSFPRCWRIMKANPVLPNEPSKQNSPQQNEISRPPNHYRNCGNRPPQLRCKCWPRPNNT